MLIDPASKVSVPLTVVICTLSNTLESVFVPPVFKRTVLSVLPITPEAIQILLLNKLKTTAPANTAEDAGRHRQRRTEKVT